MNFHTQLVGAFHAIILSLHAALMVALILALLNPAYDGGRTLAQRQTVASLQVTDQDTALSRHW